MNGLVTQFLEAILVDWYRSVSQWQPPGASSAQVCGSCRDSPVPARLALADWPHDITHPLVRELTAATHDVAQLLADAGHTVSLHVASNWLTEAIDERAGDISDILRECVEPRLAAFVHDEVETSTRELELLFSPSDD